MLREGHYRRICQAPEMPERYLGETRAVPREDPHCCARPVKAADEVCRGELRNSRNKQGRPSSGNWNHKQKPRYTESRSEDPPIKSLKQRAVTVAQTCLSSRKDLLTLRKPVVTTSSGRKIAISANKSGESSKELARAGPTRGMEERCISLGSRFY